MKFRNLADGIVKPNYTRANPKVNVRLHSPLIVLSLRLLLYPYSDNTAPIGQEKTRGSKKVRRFDRGRWFRIKYARFSTKGADARRWVQYAVDMDAGLEKGAAIRKYRTT